MMHTITVIILLSFLYVLQVVAAVGFKGRRLEIPKDLNPLVAALIESCWAKYVLLFHLYTPFSFISLNLIIRTWA